MFSIYQHSAVAPLPRPPRVLAAYKCSPPAAAARAAARSRLPSIREERPKTVQPPAAVQPVQPVQQAPPPPRRTVQWKEEIEQTKYIEDSDTESELSWQTTTTTSSVAVTFDTRSIRDTISPAQLYSTTRAPPGGLRRLTPTPSPLFRSEALQKQPSPGSGLRLRAVLKVDTVAARKGKMSSARFCTPIVELETAAAATMTSSSSTRGVGGVSSTPPPFSASSSLRRSTETLTSGGSGGSRRSSSSSSSMGSLSGSPSFSAAGAAAAAATTMAPPTTAAAAAAAARFAVKGEIEGGSELEATLEGICALLNKAHACQLRRLHVESSQAAAVDLIARMQQHLGSEFATFAWPQLLTARAKECLRRISVLTLVVEITIEHVPQKEDGILRRIGRLGGRFSHGFKDFLNFLRRLR